MRTEADLRASVKVRQLTEIDHSRFLTLGSCFMGKNKTPQQQAADSQWNWGEKHERNCTNPIPSLELCACFRPEVFGGEKEIALFGQVWFLHLGLGCLRYPHSLPQVPFWSSIRCPSRGPERDTKGTWGLSHNTGNVSGRCKIYTSG